MKLYLLPSLLAENTQHLLGAHQREVMKTLRYYFVENERTARRFISSLQLQVDIGQLQLFPLDKRTSLGQVKACFQQIAPGHDVGVLSEAGCPGIADPGARAVQYAHQQGIEVIPLPGPSSILLALMASGFSGQRFAFHGYLPVKPDERAQALRKLESQALQTGQTQIFMETPFRNDSLLASILQHCHPDTLLCIASHLTAPDQQIRTMPVQTWRKATPALHKVPVIFLIGKQEG
jgi:16S rRNA (cytidine1402-2'-O)-methyltransferase